ncbi:uncharacterized protein LOC129244713 [Anastrepha obliqua]|uniref:uncharacterized protein LOC129244713 n=1 Tax=Anastrepha obliqua TaxID=95512 RepID=UPI00240A0E2B|nr:uncharacterized protein LOC129244713 [Anastrepha obliqua]
MFKLWLIVELLLAVSSVFADPCEITLPTGLASPQPVIVANGSLLRPTNVVTSFSEDEEITLHCAGNKNKIVPLKQQTATLRCLGGDAFYYEETAQKFAFQDLNCTHEPAADLLVTENSCGSGSGVFYEVGFQVNNDFQSLFSICYNTDAHQTVYARNLLNGRALEFKVIDSTRRSFRADGMGFTTAAINNYYLVKNQRTRFETYFGSDQSYLNTTSFLARGHLAPDADFIFSYEQLASYFYVNCAPEWQAVNAGNWLRVENAVRKMATAFSSDLLTFTSTLGQLELPDDSGDLTAIYLDSNKLLPAPKWYYKVLMHPDLAVDLVILTLNNPFATVGSEVEFCTNVCDKYNLETISDFGAHAARGYTFCCELNDFWANAMGTDTPYYDLPDGWSYK